MRDKPVSPRTASGPCLGCGPGALPYGGTLALRSPSQGLGHVDPKVAGTPSKALPCSAQSLRVRSHQSSGHLLSSQHETCTSPQ